MTEQEPEGTPDAMARAEALVDRVAEQVGRSAAMLAGRAREEAEDMWAEAQHVRRSGRWSKDPS